MARIAKSNANSAHVREQHALSRVFSTIEWVFLTRVLGVLGVYKVNFTLQPKRLHTRCTVRLALSEQSFAAASHLETAAESAHGRGLVALRAPERGSTLYVSVNTGFRVILATVDIEQFGRL